MSESVSEFFDAQEVLLSASSSENEVGSLGEDVGLDREAQREEDKRRLNVTVMNVCEATGNLGSMKSRNLKPRYTGHGALVSTHSSVSVL